MADNSYDFNRTVGTGGALDGPLDRAVAKVTSSIGRLDAAGIRNQDQIDSAKAEGRIEPTRLNLNAAETTINESGTGIGVVVRVPYQGGKLALAYGRATKLSQHQPLHQYGRDVVLLTHTFSTDADAAEIRNWRRNIALVLEEYVEQNNQVIQRHNDGLAAVAGQAIQERKAQLDAVHSLRDEIGKKGT